MHIKKTQVIVAAVFMVIFFGYLMHKDILYDGSEAVEKKITTKIASQDEKKDTLLPKAPEDYGIKRAQIAIEEYRKNVIEKPRGCNCGPEIDKYTNGTPAQWCTMFASWVGKEAGSGVKDFKTESWKIVNSRDFADYLEQNGTWYDRETIIQNKIEPQIGDYVVFWRGDFEDNLGHVDVVVDLGNVPGSASLVGGNIRDQIAFRENFPFLQNYGFLGFGRPEK